MSLSRAEVVLLGVAIPALAVLIAFAIYLSRGQGPLDPAVFEEMARDHVVIRVDVSAACQRGQSGTDFGGWPRYEVLPEDVVLGDPDMVLGVVSSPSRRALYAEFLGYWRRQEGLPTVLNPDGIPVWNGDGRNVRHRPVITTVSARGDACSAGVLTFVLGPRPDDE